MSGGATQEKALVEPIKYFQTEKKKIIYFKISEKRYHFWQVATEYLFQNKKLITPENLGLDFGMMKCHGPITYCVTLSHYTLVATPGYVKITRAEGPNSKE